MGTLMSLTELTMDRDGGRRSCNQWACGGYSVVDLFHAWQSLMAMARQSTDIDGHVLVVYGGYSIWGDGKVMVRLAAPLLG